MSHKKQHMQENPVIMGETGYYQLIGDYTKETIPHNDYEMERLFKISPPVEVDLSSLNRCDSALVALLVQYKRDYPALKLESIPKKLGDLLQIYGVAQFLN